MKIFTYFLSLCFFSFVSIRSIHAQVSLQCGFDAYHREQLNNNETLRQRTILMDAQLARALDKTINHSKKRDEQVYIIPVIFHIIHDSGPENINDTLVYRAIDFLNESFRNEGWYDSTSGVSINIQFCLAQQDPYGNPTNGINRIVNPSWVLFNTADDYAMKSATAWDSQRYLNIWTVGYIFSSSTTPSGYATFPASHGSVTDGIVVRYGYLGGDPGNNALLSHEAGHYLGLYHTFEGGCANNNCLLEGDHICDTPPDTDDTPLDSCNQVLNTCTSDTVDASINNPYRPISLGGLGDQNDHVHNYMDYSQFTCLFDFTQGQKDRMRAVCENERVSLQQSLVCKPPCLAGTINGFTLSLTEAQAGIPITASAVYDTLRVHDWYVDGLPTSQAGVFTHAFTDTGFHAITLCINDTCSVCVTDTIHISCAAVSQFTASATSAVPGSLLTFDATGSVYDSLLWIIDGDTLSSTAVMVSHAFSTTGIYTVSLVAYYGTCFNTTSVLVSIKYCAARNQATHWFFGHQSGMTFNEDGTILNTTAPFITDRSSTAISDNLGGLLFLTDSYHIYDKNHNEMPSSPLMYGSPALFQSSVALKRAGNNSIYDVVIMRDAGILGFAAVDMSLNGGLGDIITDNDSVYHNNTNAVFHTVDHCNGHDKWVVTHNRNTDEYWSYLITESGVQPAVISHCGSVNAAIAAYSNIKISPDGKKIAMTFYGESFYEICDFDAATGIVSNPLKIGFPSGTYPMSLEFSSNSQVLYLGKTFPYGILQFDVSVMDSAAIKGSEYDLMAGGLSWTPTLQMGPDYKIYVNTPGSTLNVINNPNQLGTGCNYAAFAVPVTDAASYAFINFHTSLFKPADLSLFQITQTTDTLCPGQQTMLKLVSPFCTDSIAWQVNGNGIFTVNTDSTVTLTATGQGLIEIIATRSGVCDEWRDTAYLVATYPFVSVATTDTTVCEEYGPYFFTGSAGTWSGPGVNATGTFDPFTTGVGVFTLVLTYTDSLSCTGTDTMVVNVEDCESVAEWFAGNGLSVYPNPAHENIHLLLDQPLQTSTHVILVNNLGQQTRAATLQKGQKSLVIETNNLAEGMYALQLVDGLTKASLSVKVMIRH